MNPVLAYLPACRWVNSEAMIGVKAMWFVLHVCCQWFGVILFVAGFALAASKLRGKTLDSKVYEAHKVQG